MALAGEDPAQAHLRYGYSMILRTLVSYLEVDVALHTSHSLCTVSTGHDQPDESILNSINHLQSVCTVIQY